MTLLDWTGCQLQGGTRGVIPLALASILDRLQVSAESWLETIARFGRQFHRAVGLSDHLKVEARRLGVKMRVSRRPKSADCLADWVAPFCLCPRASRPATMSPELRVAGTGVVLWRQPVHHVEVGNVGVVLRVVGDQRQPMCQSDGTILQIEIRRGEAMIQLPGTYLPELAGGLLVVRKNDHLLEQVEKSL